MLEGAGAKGGEGKVPAPMRVEDLRNVIRMRELWAGF